MAPVPELPFLTIVIPCHNAAVWIGRTLQSILDQAYPCIEVIVVDDASTDASVDVARSFPGVTVVPIGKAGPQRARNTGLGLARGAYVNFFDADDYLLPGSLARIGEAVLAAGNPDMVVADYADDDGTGELVRRHRVWAGMSWTELKTRWLAMDNPHGSCIFYRRDFVAGIGGWDETASFKQDYEIGFRALLETRAVVAVPIAYFAYYHHPTPTRLSRQTSDAALVNFARLLVALDARGRDVWTGDDRAIIGDRLYAIGRVLLRRGATAAAETVLAEARVRQPDYRGRSAKDRLLIRLLGLERREKIAGAVQRIAGGGVSGRASRAAAV